MNTGLLNGANSVTYWGRLTALGTRLRLEFEDGREEETTVRDLVGPGVTKSAIQFLNRGTFSISYVPNKVYEGNWGTWDTLLESGKSYMVGDRIPLEDYVKSHRTSMSPFQKAVARWVWEHPDFYVKLSSYSTGWCGYPRSEWDYRRQGEAVVFGMPHHSSGGEKHWMTRPEFTGAILINVD